MRARFHPQQSVQEVVPLPRPQPEIPGVDFAARAAAFRPEHAGAVDRGQGQRALELRPLEVLGAVTFDDADRAGVRGQDRKSTRLNSSHLVISYAVFCLKKKKIYQTSTTLSNKETNSSDMLQSLT